MKLLLMNALVLIHRGFKKICKVMLTLFYSLAINKVGSGLYVNGVIKSNCLNKISFGKKVVVGQNVQISSELHSGQLVVGDNSSIADDCHIDISGGLAIADEVVLSKGVMIFTHDHGQDPRSIPKGKSLEIKSKVWLGARVIVLQDVEFIAEGVIVGAGAIVTKSLIEPGVYLGAPAKRIK